VKAGRGQRSEVRGQRSDIRSQRSDIRSQRSAQHLGDEAEVHISGQRSGIYLNGRA
jgi:hypothetical protein